jgi:hypothetical protein
MDKPKIWGANFAVKSEMFKRYGLFDSNLGRIQKKLYSHEEVEFIQRLQNAGEKILYYPLSIIHHCIPAYRISKKYMRKWKFDQGELDGVLMSDTKYSNFIKYHSRTNRIVILRDVIVSLLKIGCFTKDSFDHELRICHILGFLSAKMKRMHIKL